MTDKLEQNKQTVTAFYDLMLSSVFNGAGGRVMRSVRLLPLA
jgi:hypothetical protein